MIKEDCPAELRVLIERCWDGDSNARPTMERVCGVLGGLLAQMSVEEEETNIVHAKKRIAVGDSLGSSSASEGITSGSGTGPRLSGRVSGQRSGLASGGEVVFSDV